MTNRVSEMPGYEDLPKQQEAEYIESWKVDAGLDVELRMVISKDQGSVVYVNYRVNTTRQDWNKK